ncbi:MAG: pyridoxal 5'-phosphate synthase, partial [Pseudomonadales bacterium]|nr:pyridoxal 5'-phosphate synthase [Pseudomonadales bacterium]
MEEFLQQENPIVILEQWLEDAKGTNLRNPNAFVVSTVAGGQPSSRVVLVKEIRNDGIVFYTNYNSRKGHEIAENPLASANFHWDALGRQICICGSLTKNSREESVEYWNSRPRESRIAQYVSHQSEPVQDRATLEDLFR